MHKHSKQVKLKGWVEQSPKWLLENYEAARIEIVSFAAIIRIVRQPTLITAVKETKIEITTNNFHRLLQFWRLLQKNY